MPSAHDHCRGFSRSELLRGAAARAGRGLPDIEPGMPVPAGTGLTRRSVLLRSAGLALSIYGAQALAPRALEEGVAAAQASSAGERVLVSVFLAGGLDSMTLLAPTGDPRYAELRPALALPAHQGTPFTEDARLRWHPSAAALATLHGEGKMTVLPAIGYASPNQSHFTSRHFWEVGATDPHGRVGWLGRYLDREGSADNPLQGLSLSPTLYPSLATQENPVAAVSRPEAYTFTSPGVSNPVQAPMLRAFGDLGRLPGGDEAIASARSAVAVTGELRARMEPFQPVGGNPAYTSPVDYPTGNDFPRRLAALAAMLAAGLPIRCVSVDAAGGYDTHANQATSLPRDLKLTADSLLAFQRDLEARGLADRVLIHVWSEFGRRPRENGSGTDHGAAGASLVIGSRVRGRMVGEFPGLDQLDASSNLRATSDFRAVYCSLLEQWFGVDAGPIIPGAGSFSRPALVAA